MAERRPPAFRSLLASQISSTADELRKSVTLRLRREHDVSLAQVRTLALIEYLQPVRLRDVALDAGADKAQISRVVSSLVERGYVVRRALAKDARSAHLELTDSGREKLGVLVKLMQERDRVLRAALQADEADSLTALLARIRGTAEQLALDEERLNRSSEATRQKAA